jgi:nucleotide-binding universal stress UspA family protein
MLKIRTILHPTDFSELSRPAFELACALARDYGAELGIMHVHRPALGTIPLGVAVEVPAGDETIVQQQLEQIRPTDPKITVWHRLVEGEPVEQILRLAEEVQADLIVMGTHGRGGLSRVFMGSVAEGVLRQANCPVLTYRAKPTTGEDALDKATEGHAIGG